MQTFIKKLKENLIPLSFMLSIPILNVFYGILNNNNRGAYNLMTDLDRVTPFLKIFIIPYVIWYFYVVAVMVYLCFNDKKLYYKSLITFDVGLVACYIVYFFFQTTVPRPELIGNDILTKMVSFIYNNDNPYNCFPSIHVLTTYVVMKGINNSLIDNIKARFTINITGILIILSTLFVKQHVILDAISAILLVDIIFYFVTNYDGEKVLSWPKKLYSLLTMKKKLES